MEIDPVIYEFCFHSSRFIGSVSTIVSDLEARAKMDVGHGHRDIQWANLIISSETSSLHQRFLAFALGLSFRFALHSQPDSQTFFIMEYLFVVLSVRDSLYQRRDTHLDHLYSSHVGSLRPITFCLAAWHDTINVTSILLYPLIELPRCS